MVSHICFMEIDHDLYNIYFYLFAVQNFDFKSQIKMKIIISLLNISGTGGAVQNSISFISEIEKYEKKSNLFIYCIKDSIAHKIAKQQNIQHHVFRKGIAFSFLNL